MTRQNTLQCAHEPFGDAFYYGPERLGERYENDEKGRLSSGFSKTKYQDVLDRLERDGSEVRHLFLAFPPLELIFLAAYCQFYQTKSQCFFTLKQSKIFQSSQAMACIELTTEVGEARLHQRHGILLSASQQRSPINCTIATQVCK